MRQEECVLIVLRRFDAPDGDPTEPGSYSWNFFVDLEPNLRSAKEEDFKGRRFTSGKRRPPTAYRPRLTLQGRGRQA
jgi:hypothetical protein